MTKIILIKHIACLILLFMMLGCETILLPEQDMELNWIIPSTEDFLTGGVSGGEIEGGELSGNMGGNLSGNTFAGDSLLPAGDQVLLNDWRLNEGGMNAGEIADELCGSERCHPDALCVSNIERIAQCECAPMFEGDGLHCTPQRCPINASGAPYCQCDEGYEGTLYYELSDRDWRGTCEYVSPCRLKMISASDFVPIESSNPTEVALPGQEIHYSCIPTNDGIERFRYSLSEGIIYTWHSVDERATECEEIVAPTQQDPIDFWAYSGGVLNEAYLQHLPMMSYTLGECTYHILMTLNTHQGSQVTRVYLAPAGISCSEGVRESVSCGVGACRVSGEVVCTDGEWIDHCEPITPLDSLDLCDFLDNDCDGRIDEGFESETTQCGIGACRSNGMTSCEVGQVKDSCSALQPLGADLTCDGIDDDCDGEIDEAYVTQLISCGEGVCRAEGSIRCETGTEVTDCNPLVATGDDVDCDGIDQDCDGTMDEEYQGIPVTCGVGACLFDGLTRCVNGIPEDECTPLAPAEDDSSCDGVDDDCDGVTDENVEDETISCGLGSCITSGVRTCIEGEIHNRCTPQAPLGTDQNCDGVDDDCDGQVDEQFESEPVLCSGAGVYACSVTTPLLCVLGTTTFSCDEALSAITDDTCDGIDDDCDGQLDESYQSIEVSCGLGECADSSFTRCIEGEVIDRCLVRTPTGDDSDCDGRDDDCDGTIDESFVEQELVCGQGLCVTTGITHCEAGIYTHDCQPLLPVNSNEQECDGLDNDCDGRVDERFSSTRTACGDGVCAAIGSSSCSNGVIADNCVPLPSTGNDADCDGIDQDCDANTDESYPPVIDVCGTGVCYNTAPSSCVAGAVQNNCVPLPQQGNDSLCDGIDQDCDGRIDEAYQPVPTTCTYGSVCVQDGLTACVNGSVISVCEPPVFYTGSDRSCNLQDNDCDGRIDEGFVGGIFYCGHGVCQGSGNRSCINGVEAGGVCNTSNPTGNDGECDGIDQDCDGRSDEHYGTRNTTCGLGVCARDGTNTCRNGSISSSCTPGQPQGDDSDTNGRDDDCDGRVDEDSIPPETNCNGVDDDFDGSVDEGYGVSNTTCGVGACARNGIRYCENGQVINTCIPGGSADNDCDGQDEDCDGSFDEHYSGGGTSCGVGACSRNGTRICQSGSVVNTCVAGSPSNELLNNNIDDDCDGTTDEGVPVPQDPVGSVLYRCDLTGGNWYTRQLVSSGWMFWSAGHECYRSGGFIYNATGYTFIDGTPRAPGTGECINACQ